LKPQKQRGKGADRENLLGKKREGVIKKDLVGGEGEKVFLSGKGNCLWGKKKE